MEIIQHPIRGDAKCSWHGQEGRTFSDEEMLPQGVCPWLYNIIYPYFLGLYYGADFGGSCNVCCPALKGVDVVIKKEANDGHFDNRISSAMSYVIFAEIVKVGDCHYCHTVGERIIFPTCMPEHFMCPAAFHSIFLVMRLGLPPCIDKNNLRCPDWDNVITFETGRK